MKVSLALTTLLAGLAAATPIVEITVTDDITVKEDTQDCVHRGRQCNPRRDDCCHGLTCRIVCFLPTKPT